MAERYPSTVDRMAMALESSWSINLKLYKTKLKGTLRLIIFLVFLGNSEPKKYTTRIIPI
jgi:hypothetical protein